MASWVGAVVFCAWAGFSFSMNRVPDEFTAMQPTVEPASFYILDRRVCRTGEWTRGAIVRFRPPGVGSASVPFAAARIVAVAGDKVTIHAGGVVVNGQPLHWDGFAPPLNEEMPELRVPAGRLLLLADNGAVASEKAVDTRAFGMIPDYRVEGVLIPF